MLHEPAAKVGEDPAFPYKRRLGVRLFLVYALIYAAFIGLNVIKPTLTETLLFSGINLVAVYGFGLIIFALLLALVYSSMCSRREKSLANGKEA